MEIVEQIKQNFNKGYFNRSMVISDLPQKYPAWTLKTDKWIAVAIPLNKYVPFSEDFSRIRLCSYPHLEIEGYGDLAVLMLLCYNPAARNEFAILCKNFVDPGPNGVVRKEILSDPSIWWRNWKDLIGNRSSSQSPCSVIGELITVEKLMKKGYSARWTGCDYTTHDIELEGCSIEVKSTISRYGYEVTISSVYQMQKASMKPLYLSFIRLERSKLGRSIDDLVKSLISLGYSQTKIETELKVLGFETGRVARSERYKVLEWKLYPVDDRFPVVTEASFKNDRLPPNVLRFTYTVDLSGLNGENLLNQKDELGCLT